MDNDDAQYEWIHTTAQERITKFGALLVTVVVLIFSWQVLNIRYGFLASAPKWTIDLLMRMYPPDYSYSGEIIRPLIQTINIAVVGTTLGIIMATPVAYIGANNTTPNKITYGIGKFIISASRSVNVIIWALIFIAIFGPGVLAGTVAVGVRSIGQLAKLLSEDIEEIDKTQVEAIQAMGGSSFDTLIYAIVPQIKPIFVGLTTYRWDVNVRMASVLGLVGAGGIGQNLITSVNSFEWGRVLMILLAILCIVIFSEVISAYFRNKVR